MYHELKKIYSESYVKVLLLIIGCVSVMIPLIAIHSFSAIESVDSVETVKGEQAITLLKERYESYKGELTIDKLNTALNYYKSETDEDLAYLKASLKYPGIINLLNDAYLSIYDDTAPLWDLQNTDDFYRRNRVQIEEALAYSGMNYTLWEKESILEKAEDIEIPFNIDFSAHWVFAYKLLSILILMIFFSAVMIGSRIFSYEKETNMDVILATVGKEKRLRVGKNKVYALLTVLTLMYGASMIITSILFFSKAGVGSWGSQIQLEYFTSIYKLSFGDAYLQCLIVGWLCTMAIGVFVAFINVVLQKSYPSLILGILLVFIPVIMTRLTTLPVAVRKVFEVQPVNGFMIERNLSSYHLYGGAIFKMLTNTALSLYAMVLILIGIILIPFLFCARVKE